MGSDLGLNDDTISEDRIAGSFMDYLKLVVEITVIMALKLMVGGLF